MLQIECRDQNSPGFGSISPIGRESLDTLTSVRVVISVNDLPRRFLLEYETDGSGSIDGHELANALRSFGYNLTPPILSLIEQKYGK